MDDVAAEVVMRKDGVMMCDKVNRCVRWRVWALLLLIFRGSVTWSCFSGVQEKIEHSVKLLMNLFFLPFRHWRTKRFKMGWDGRTACRPEVLLKLINSSINRTSIKLIKYQMSNFRRFNTFAGNSIAKPFIGKIWIYENRQTWWFQDILVESQHVTKAQRKTLFIFKRLQAKQFGCCWLNTLR